MEYLTAEQVLFLHFRLVAETGGAHGLANPDLLLSALARPRATFAGRDLYPTLCLKAAALAESLIRNHPFVDGNKRTGIAAGMLFLRRNGSRLTPSNAELERTALAVATGEMDLASLADVFRRWTDSEGDDPA